MAAIDRPSTVDCRRSCNSCPLVSFSSSIWFCDSVAMSTRVRSKALARSTRCDSELSRCEVACTVAMAGDRRRSMNSPTVCVPGMGVSCSCSMRCTTRLWYAMVAEKRYMCVAVARSMRAARPIRVLSNS